MTERQLSKAERDAFEALRDTYRDKLRPQHVVDAARPVASPLHGRFEWDDSKAAERWRVSQASQLIKRAKVTVLAQPVPQVRARPAAPAPSVPLQRYMPPLRAVPPANALGTLADAKRELSSFRARFSGMRELSALFLEIEKVLNPKTIGESAVTAAASLALDLEARGHDRQNATARAATAYGVSRHAVLEAVREAS